MSIYQRAATCALGDVSFLVSILKINALAEHPTLMMRVSTFAGLDKRPQKRAHLNRNAAALERAKVAQPY
jgi:hypothetical protein